MNGFYIYSWFTWYVYTDGNTNWMYSPVRLYDAYGQYSCIGRVRFKQKKTI